VAEGPGVSIVFEIDDQVRLGGLKTVPMRDLAIERTLWQLRSRGRIDVPATVAFERIIRQGQPAAELV
jgi:hypothetical protein